MEPKDLIKQGCTCIQSVTTPVFVGICKGGAATIYINEKESITLWFDGQVTNAFVQVDLKK